MPSQPTEQSQNLERLGLEWLVPLWSARDPQMRFSGFAIAATVAQTRIGAIALANSFMSCSGGIWNMVSFVKVIGCYNTACSCSDVVHIYSPSRSVRC